MNKNGVIFARRQFNLLLNARRDYFLQPVLTSAVSMASTSPLYFATSAAWSPESLLAGMSTKNTVAASTLAFVSCIEENFANSLRASDILKAN